MQNRTFLRTMLDLFFDNAFIKAIQACVKFCNEQQYYHREKLKFLKNVPLDNIDKNPFYRDKFIFKVTK